jgi:hypothetical protein
VPCPALAQYATWADFYMSKVGSNYALNVYKTPIRAWMKPDSLFNHFKYIVVVDSAVDPADSTWIYPNSLRTDSLFGHLYGYADSLRYLLTNYNDTNMFFGIGAGNTNIARYSNSFGMYSMRDAGSLSLYNNAFGFEALTASGSGGQGNGNNAFGFRAMKNCSTGVDNNAFGLNVLRDLKQGDNNTFMGDQAGMLMPMGEQNTAIGQSAMIQADTCNKNTAIGAEALYNMRDDGNIAIGYQSYYYNKYGNLGIGIGYKAGVLTFNDTLIQDTTIALGFKAYADSQGIAIGDSAIAKLKNSGAIGNHTTARKQNYITILNVDSDTLSGKQLTLSSSDTTTFSHSGDSAHVLTTASNVHFDKNVYIDGNVTGSVYYGGMYIHSDAGVTIPFAADSTWYTFTGLTAGMLNGFTHTDSVLTASYGSVYKVTYNAKGTGQNNHIYHIAVARNDTILVNTEDHMTGQSGVITPMAGGGHITAVAGSKIKLKIQDASGTGNGTLYNVNIHLERIGN